MGDDKNVKQNQILGSTGNNPQAVDSEFLPAALKSMTLLSPRP